MTDFFEKKVLRQPAQVKKILWHLKRQSLSLLAILVFSFPLIAQDFKIIGYLPNYRFHLNDQIEYDKLTHLCVGFANPDIHGNLSLEGKDITPLVQSAHRSGVAVFLSLAGGGQLPKWKTAWKKLTKPEYRSAFIQKITAFTRGHHLQGVDVDLEWHSVDENYSGFVLELKDTLIKYGIQLTAALPGIHRYPQITDETLAAFDWINVMAYDLTGPWEPKKVGQHAPMFFAEDCIHYWKHQGVPVEKLNLGLPFYGFDFMNKRKIKSASFGKLVEENPELAYLDKSDKTFYNGILTIEAKTKLALEELGGVMIWELGQDAFNEYSLLSTIHETVETHFKRTKIEEIPLLAETEIKPVIAGQQPTKVVENRPYQFDLELTVWEESPKNGRLILEDMQGREIFSKPLHYDNSIRLNTAFLLGGLNFIEVIVENEMLSKL